MGPGSIGGGSITKRAEPAAVRARLSGSAITGSQQVAISMAAKKFGTRARTRRLRPMAKSSSSTGDVQPRSRGRSAGAFQRQKIDRILQVIR